MIVVCLVGAVATLASKKHMRSSLHLLKRRVGYSCHKQDRLRYRLRNKAHRLSLIRHSPSSDRIQCYVLRPMQSAKASNQYRSAGRRAVIRSSLRVVSRIAVPANGPVGRRPGRMFMHRRAWREHPQLPRIGCGPTCPKHVRADVVVLRSSYRCLRGFRAAFPWPHRGRDGQVPWFRPSGCRMM